MKLLEAAAVITLMGHALLAVGALVYLPHGFPPGHERFWANLVVPLGLLVLSAAWALPRWRRAGVLSLGAFWLSLSLLSVPLFPASGHRLLPVTLTAAFTLLLMAGVLAKDAVRVPRGALLAVVFGALLGALAISQQRAPAPSTRPLGGALHLHEVGEGLVVPASADLDPPGARVRVACGVAMLEVSPLLTFYNRSPDRFWTNLAPPESSGSSRVLLASPQRDDALLFRYRDDDGESTLELDERPGAVRLDARALLRAPVFSHLNEYASVRVLNVERLAIRFSPTATATFDSLPFDYPEGRPLRFGYLDGERLHVVEGRSAEKGPFRLLGQGALARGQPLVMTLVSEGAALCAITLEDFSAQASGDLSPSAGWGVTQSSIEFYRDDDGSHFIRMSLASTGPGYGFDSVGHAAGIYRNRMLIERASPALEGE